MKRGTPRHPKTDELARLLSLHRWGAVGILEMLWHFAAEFAHQGDVGKFSNDAIGHALCWDGASTMLVSALTDSRWLDACPCHRLRIHNWPKHADQTVQRVLRKRNQWFLKCYDDASTMLARCYDETSQPSPSPSPSPLPVHASIGDQVTEQMAISWLEETQKAGSDYTMQETMHAYKSLKAVGWKIGVNPVVDYRAALESRINYSRDQKRSSERISTVQNPTNYVT